MRCLGVNKLKIQNPVMIFTMIYLKTSIDISKKVYIGAQNGHPAKNGAFTGEISPAMVKEFCKYAILGHSERRQYFGETDETVNKRVLAAQKHGIIPIVCVGETLAENEAGQTADVVRRQTTGALQGVDADFAPSLVLAYEPVWAIGTGKAASGESAQVVHGQVIRATLIELFGQEIAHGRKDGRFPGARPATDQDAFAELHGLL